MEEEGLGPLEEEPLEGETPQPAPEPSPRREFVGTGLFWGLVIGIVLAILVIILAAQNTRSATITFLGFDWSTPLIVVILGSLLAGVVLDEIVGLVYRARRRRILREREELKRLRGSRD